MITSKQMPFLVSIFVCAALLVCFLMFYAVSAFETTSIPAYQNKLFGDEVVTLEIRVDPQEWQKMLDNAMAKEWISGDLIINGETFTMVGIRPKGNSSLSTFARSSGNRYSLQLKFDKYVKGQTYYGLDTFCVNNLMGDATYMKDYLSYEIMDFAGVPSPLKNFASVTVNGQDYGFMLALERYDEAFLDRVYNTSSGQLYNVKMSMGQPGNAPAGAGEPGNRGGFAPWVMPQFDPNAIPEGMPQFDQNFRPENMLNVLDRQGGFGPGIGRSGGGSLVYTNDDVASYSAIFDNAVSNKVSDREKQAVITALKNLQTGTDLERYFDVDQILRYFAAHTVVVNTDSYISNMQQNYYLYERGGKLTILPWDYNLAFGGFQSGNATSVINFPIDTPVSGVTMEERPLLDQLLKVPEYKERYHEYLRDIVENYFESGLYASTIAKIDQKINAYVQADETSFFRYEQYQASLPHLIEWGNLRAQSIKGQLEGTIPSTTSGQTVNRGALIDASSINLSILGSMMGGMGQEMRGDFGRGLPAVPGQRQREQNANQQVPNQVPNQLPNQVPNQARNQVPNQAPNRAPNQAPNRVPNQVLGPALDQKQTNNQREYFLVILVLLILVIGAMVVITRPRKNVL